MTPSEELRAAARHLRALAAKASPEGGPLSQWEHDEGMVWGEGGFAVVSVRAEEGRWIAAMSPAVAEPLALWLEDAANNIEDEPMGGFIEIRAMAFARSLVTNPDGEPQ